jgi:hypothetical protein
LCSVFAGIKEQVTGNLHGLVLHSSGKEKQPTRTFNCSVNHHRKFLHVTPGHPGRWNDKTLVLFDEFVLAIKNGTVLSDVDFKLLERNAEGTVIEKKYRGAWAMVDNGYLSWSVTVPPMKTTAYMAELRWSKWVESLRKDVECAFGILKGRFRLLKSGVRCEKVTDVDKVFKTCVALHNWLLSYDGLDAEWNTGKKGTWEGPDGILQHRNAIRIIARANSTKDAMNRARGFDSSGMGLGNDGSMTLVSGIDRIALEDTSSQNNYELPDGTRLVRFMKMADFRDKLIAHFDIQWRRKQVCCPTRNRELEWEPHKVDS